jgi:hypothetical protein
METNPRSATRPPRGFAQRLKEDGRRTIEQRKRSAAERVDGIAQALERSGAQFSETEPTLADLANRIAGTVGNLATRLREGSIDDLVDDTRALARRNPGPVHRWRRRRWLCARTLRESLGAPCAHADRRSRRDHR